MRRSALGEYIYPQIVVGVRDNIGRERKLVHIPNVIAGAKTGGGDVIPVMTAGLSFTMVVDYDNFQYGQAFVGLEGSSSHHNYIDNKNSHAYLSVQFSGVRY